MTSENPGTAGVEGEKQTAGAVDTPALKARRAKAKGYLRARDYDKLDDLLFELIEETPEDVPFFFEITDILQRNGEGARAGAVLPLLVPGLKSRGKHGLVLEVVKKAVALDSRDRDLAANFLEAYRELHKGNPRLSRYIRFSRIEEGRNLKKAARLLTLYADFDEGTYVLHQSGWGVGRVVETSPAEELVTVDFADRRGHTVELEVADDIFSPLPAGGFLAMSLDRPAELEALAEEDSVRLVKAVLADFDRPASVRHIRDRLTGAEIVAASGWSKFWNRAKKNLLKDPYIESEKDGFRLLEIPRAFEDKVFEQADKATTVSERISAVRNMLKNSREVAKDSRFATDYVNKLVETSAVLAEKNPGRAVEICFLVEDLPNGCECPPLPYAAAGLIEGCGDPVELLAEIEYPIYLKKALGLVRDVLPERWPEIYYKAFFRVHRDGWDLITDSLAAAGHIDIVNRSFSTVIRKKEKYPLHYVYVLKNVFEGKLPAGIEVPEKFFLLENLLGLYHRMQASRTRIFTKESPSEVRKIISAVHHTITAGKLKYFRDFAEGARPEQVLTLLNLLEYTHGLDGATTDGIKTVFAQAFPEVFRARLDAVREIPAVYDVVYATRAALARKEVEFAHIRDVLVPENQEAIGRAVEMGDLSENAEYDAAIERSQRLGERLRTLRDEIANVEVLDAAKISPDSVVIGTMVRVRVLPDGDEREFTVLGPWDSDPDRNVLSNRAPVAQALLGKKVGETARVELPDTTVTYEILEIKVSGLL